MAQKYLDLIISESIAEIKMCYEPSNILDFAMMGELDSAMEQASKCAVLILSSGLKHFSMGVDIKIHTPDKVPQMLTSFHSIIRKLYDFPGVTVCLLHGYALGGGLELALPCDLIYAHEDAKLGFPEIRLACFPPVAAVLLPAIIGRHANSMVLLGDTIPAKQAQAIGLVDELVPDESKFRDDFRKKISANSHDALRMTKKVLRRSSGFQFHDALTDAEKVYIEEMMQSPDAAEGIRAFVEKRPPQYRR